MSSIQKSARCSDSTFHLIATVGILFTLLAFSASSAFAQGFSTLHDFGTLPDGVNPFGRLVADAAGNLYGATVYGGTTGRGTIFQLSPPVSGGTWTETILYSFQGGSDGDEPFSQLTVDQHGNLFGVTALGGNQDEICTTGGCGTVFELSPPAAQGGGWTESILYRFSPTTGFTPSGGLLLGGENILYGTTSNGGPTKNAGGTVFKLARIGGTWREATLYTFPYWGLAGNVPAGPLIQDSAGRLYGVTSGTGSQGVGGNLFQLAPPAESGGKWTLSILLNLTTGSPAGTGGMVPLVMGADGSIYGEAYTGGSGGAGNVYRLMPPASAGGSWTQTILYAFDSSANNGNPVGGLTVGRNSHVLYGTTRAVYGTVFQLSPPAHAGSQWTYSTLHTFTNGSDGWEPGGVIVGTSGDLFGVTSWGGSGQYGTLFQITP